MSKSNYILLIALSGIFLTPTHADPRVPSAPLPLFSEDFENTVGQTTPAAGQVLSLAEYLSAQNGSSNTAMSYTAEGQRPQLHGTVPYWLDKNYCNGVWLNSTTPLPAGPLPATPYGSDTTYCGSTAKQADNWSYIRALSLALGIQKYGSGSPQAASNHAITAYTEMTGNPANGATVPLVQLKMADSVKLAHSGRYVGVSVTMAAINCKRDFPTSPAVDPQVSFYLVNDPSQPSLPNSNASNVLKLNNVPTNPCDSDTPIVVSKPGGSGNANVRAKQLSADKPTLVMTNTVAVQLVNENSGGYGNDAAFDNLTIWDESPSLHKEFSPSKIPASGTTNLTFIVTNTTDLHAKSGWSFKDRMPAGLVISGAPTSTCLTPPTMSVDAATNTFTVSSGELQGGEAFCEIVMPVKLAPTTPIPGNDGVTYLNQPTPATAPGAGEVTDLVGLLPPVEAALLVKPLVDMKAELGSAPAQAPSGNEVTVVTKCTNAGPDVAKPASCVVTVEAGSSPLQSISTVCAPTSPAMALADGESMVCTTKFIPASAGTVTLMTTASTDTEESDTNNNALTTPVTITANADMAASAPVSIAGESGVPVSVISTCTNKGPDAAVNATCTLGTIPTDATDVTTTCNPAAGATLAAGAAPMVCTTTFTPTKSGTINLTTTAKSDTKDNNPANDTAPTVVTVSQTQADMQSSSPKTVNGTVNQPVSITSTCTNAGPDAAVAASCTVSGAPAGATTVCTPTTPVTSLAKGDIISCTTTFTPTTTSSITLVTTAATTSTDPDASNDVSSAQVTFGGAAASPTPVPVNSALMLSLLSLLMGAPLARRAYKRKSNG